MLPERKNFQKYIGMGVAMWDDSIGCAVKRKIASVTATYIDGCDRPQIVHIRLYHRGKGRPGDDPMFDSSSVSPEHLYRNKGECARAHFSAWLKIDFARILECSDELSGIEERKRLVSKTADETKRHVETLKDEARKKKWWKE